MTFWEVSWRTSSNIFTAECCSCSWGVQLLQCAWYKEGRIPQLFRPHLALEVCLSIGSRCSCCDGVPTPEPAGVPAPPAQLVSSHLHTVPFSYSLSAWAGFWPLPTQQACSSLLLIHLPTRVTLRVRSVCIETGGTDGAVSEKHHRKNINLLFRMQTLDLGVLFACQEERDTNYWGQRLMHTVSYVPISLNTSSAIHCWVSEYRGKCTVILSLLNITFVVH